MRWFSDLWHGQIQNQGEQKAHISDNTADDGSRRRLYRDLDCYVTLV